MFAFHEQSFWASYSNDDNNNNITTTTTIIYGNNVSTTTNKHTIIAKLTGIAGRGGEGESILRVESSLLLLSDDL